MIIWGMELMSATDHLRFGILVSDNINWFIMPDKKQPGKPSEIPEPKIIPEVKPVEEPGEPVLPEEDPEIIPDEDPPPFEIPEPGEGP